MERSFHQPRIRSSRAGKLCPVSTGRYWPAMCPPSRPRRKRVGAARTGVRRPSPRSANPAKKQIRPAPRCACRRDPPGRLPILRLSAARSERVGTGRTGCGRAMPRRRNAPSMRESRTQEARIAALLARPRTHYPAARCVPLAEVSQFCGLQNPRYHPTWPGAVAGTQPSLRTPAHRRPPAARFVAAAAPMALCAPFCYGKGPSRSTRLTSASEGAPPPGAFAPVAASSAVRLAAQG